MGAQISIKPGFWYEPKIVNVSHCALLVNLEPSSTPSSRNLDFEYYVPRLKIPPPLDLWPMVSCQEFSKPHLAPQAENVGGLQSFPLDESSVYLHNQHHHHLHHAIQHNCNTAAAQAEATRDPTASPSQSRSHRRNVSAPHVPKRTVSRLTSLENNVNLNNNNSTTVKHHQSSPSRRVMTTPVTSAGKEFFRIFPNFSEFFSLS